MKSTDDIAAERTAASHSLAAAGHRDRLTTRASGDSTKSTEAMTRRSSRPEPLDLGLRSLQPCGGQPVVQHRHRGDGLPAAGPDTERYASRAYTQVRRSTMRYKIALLKTDEGYSVSVPGLPGCWSQGITEAEALQNIQDAIQEYTAVRDELLEGAVVREVEVTP